MRLKKLTLDQALTSTISWVSLTCKQEDNRMLWIVNNLAETLKVGEQQVSTLVSSETTTETNNKSVRIHALEQ